MNANLENMNILFIPPAGFSKDSAYFVIQCSGDIQLISVNSNVVLFTMQHERLNEFHTQQYLYFFNNDEDIFFKFKNTSRNQI
jgi:uncharacterized membrane protein